jgi:hypothetical protein
MLFYVMKCFGVLYSVMLCNIFLFLNMLYSVMLCNIFLFLNKLYSVMLCKIFLFLNMLHSLPNNMIFYNIVTEILLISFIFDFYHYYNFNDCHDYSYSCDADFLS